MARKSGKNRSPEPDGAPQVLSVRTARKDARQVVTLQCLEDADMYTVECDVYPVSSMRVEPIKPGPYQFRSLEEANAFIDASVEALVYLGCDVS